MTGLFCSLLKYYYLDKHNSLSSTLRVCVSVYVYVCVFVFVNQWLYEISSVVEIIYCLRLYSGLRDDTVLRSHTESMSSQCVYV